MTYKVSGDAVAISDVFIWAILIFIKCLKVYVKLIYNVKFMFFYHDYDKKSRNSTGEHSIRRLTILVWYQIN